MKTYFLMRVTFIQLQIIENLDLKVFNKNARFRVGWEGDGLKRLNNFNYKQI